MYQGKPSYRTQASTSPSSARCPSNKLVFGLMLAASSGFACDKDVLISEEVVMRPQLKIVLGIMLLSAVSVAQDAPKNKNQATRDAAGSGREAQSAGIVEKQPVPNAVAAKPNATGETHEFSETEKRGYALGVELGSD